MLGSEAVTRALVRQLREMMPARLNMLRARYGATLTQLPDFALIEPDELDIMSLDEYPALFVVPVNTSGRQDNKQTDQSGTFDEYSFVYNVQVYIYARGDDYKSTSLRTKRYMLAARECLLARKSILEGVENLSIEPRTIQESYSAIGKVPDGNKFIGGGYIDVQIVSEERVESPLVDVEVEIEHETHVHMPKTPLPEWNIDV
ncbi:hypothetical protein SEA_JKERNS_13 [Arthrobacter phage JKerns]|uniref:Tail terminator n=8 Tax=Marthavirus TaxID=1980936 RepID=A0A514A5H9_9CAUD|nr:hypothetical protein FDH49_gp13 [Arthrobacter phage Martha]YP_009601723.1 hypothetical protein FDH50_gp13 [Arthrobacter phage Sonny]YP_009612466.1 hypothetical protein FDI42_gp13 [Arthrobacter phage Shade]YP_009884234.1 hypothetical protein HYP98_gp13 [Arthrobacter phage Zartrosa]ALY10470.1 hypothetical protein TAEYOUNG_13 [Arthrobacter phage TaeYoung]KUR65793.1 hypothetical protein JM67_03290 [Arthrobacter sp. ATCC 21022]QDH48503.1 hypothetical protein SEA_GREKAYCON_13 [Arthrobacter phage